MTVGSNRTWLATDQTRPAHVHRVEIAQSLWWMSFEDSIRIHASAHVRRLVQCGRAKRGNSLACPQKTRPCHDVAKAAGLGWNWSPQCKYSTCLLALSGSRVSTWYKKIRKKSLRVNCEGCLAAVCQLVKRELLGDQKGHTSAQPIPVESQTSRKGGWRPNPDPCIQKPTQLTGVPSEHQCCHHTSSKLCRNLEQPLFIMTVGKPGERGMSRTRTPRTHAHTPMVSVCSEKRDGDKNDHQALSSRTTNDGCWWWWCNRNPCISKDSEDADEDASQHHVPATAATVNTKGRASCAARVLSCLVWEGQCQTWVTCGWAVGAGQNKDIV